MNQFLIGITGVDPINKYSTQKTIFSQTVEHMEHLSNFAYIAPLSICKNLELYFLSKML